MYRFFYRIVFNLTREFSKTLRSTESWIPICLPKFQQDCQVYAHFSSLSDDCLTNLMFITGDQNGFNDLSIAKRNITNHLYCLLQPHFLLIIPTAVIS